MKLSSTRNYNNGTTPEYEVCPEAVDFENNSNSYKHGLLEAVGVTPIRSDVSILPGWDILVEYSHFLHPVTIPTQNGANGACGQNMSCSPVQSSNPNCGVSMNCAQ